ncbi:primosomal protein N' [Thalassotalea ponticola]|uniref:primosomal protein N' n=1 Tax=Thalassotalea ponticola TaxID=1523392 RepID=UPI0025B5BAC4|nr:primosomal protein N' [Thalassotalea ponticola]MDN3653749.1 primosomal protein N' [Thalassotalea ponticola]
MVTIQVINLANENDIVLSDKDIFIEVALPVPMRQTFTYRADPLLVDAQIVIGARVLVPFANRQLIGVVITTHQQAGLATDKIKSIIDVLPSQGNFTELQVQFLQRVSQYYHHPVGEVIASALPTLLRQVEPVDIEPTPCWSKHSQLTVAEFEQCKAQISANAHQQLALLDYFADQKQLTWPEIRMAGFNKTQLNALVNKGLLEQGQVTEQRYQFQSGQVQQANKPRLSLEQSLVISAIGSQLQSFSCHLIDGVTGSGKTEVYLQLIEKVLEQNKQVLVLVPEIGLTPQTLGRFEKRFAVPVALHHSALSDKERLQTWLQSKSGRAAIVIATRSGVFTPMLNPGLIVIDEEHDGSFKQQEGFRYHARDIAVLRARQLNIPIVLGSATPALETLHNANAKKYQYHQLTKRAGNSQFADVELIDMSKDVIEFGLSSRLKLAIEQTLAKDEQVLLFLNRRGFAPAISCQECHWICHCQRCDKPYTLHQNQGLLMCHHCGSQKRIVKQCQQCGSIRLKTLGQGTEQLEQRLNELFPNYSSVRIDRDSTRKKGELARLLQQVNNNEHHILVGTQMLAKGHHFANVTLVAVLDVDGALFSYDFRAPEHMAQLLVQVAGRAGRESKKGKVYVQTHYPDHPLLQDLVNNGYGHFAQFALTERQQALMPPYTFQALFRAQANKPQLPQSLLRDVAQHAGSECMVSGPIPPPMEKKAGKYRYHLLLQSAQRKTLHQAVQQIIEQIEQHPNKNKVRWSVDIDPQELTW